MTGLSRSANRKKRGRDGGRDSGRPVAHDAEQCKERNPVERCINKIRAWRGPATRYDKAPASYVAGLQLRGSIIWMRSLNLGPRSRRPAGKPTVATAHNLPPNSPPLKRQSLMPPPASTTVTHS